MTIFTFTEFWWLYAMFLFLVLIFVGIDLGLFNKKPREQAAGDAVKWTGIWIGLALIFNLFLYLFMRYYLSTGQLSQQIENSDTNGLAAMLALEFLTGYLVEKSLAIDNIFVFAMIFSYFQIPKIYQHRVLLWGIIGTIVFRSAFIGMGSIVMRYPAVIVFFGVILMLSGCKMLFINKTDQKDRKNLLAEFIKSKFNYHEELVADKFFIWKNGRRFFTPLFLSLLFIEGADLIFAFDSVPAIFAITKEPFIVFTSNIFAILGLRSMYFLLIEFTHRFHLIKYGLSLVLIFIGLKMVWLNEHFGGKFPVYWSLAIIGILIGGSIFASILVPPSTAKPRPQS